MARYSDEFLAALKYAYEEGNETLAELSIRFGIGITTITNLARKHGWKRRSQRMKECPPALDLLAQAKELAANDAPLHLSHGERSTRVSASGEGLESARVSIPLTPALSPQGRGSTGAVPGSEESASAVPALPSDDERANAIGRLEALVLKEIAAEEMVRDELKARPRARGETEKSARALSILTETWRTLQVMRSGAPLPTDYDDADVPTDLDAFRDELARRIDAFVAQRGDEADAAVLDGPRPDAAQ